MHVIVSHCGLLLVEPSNVVELPEFFVFGFFGCRFTSRGLCAPVRRSYPRPPADVLPIGGMSNLAPVHDIVARRCGVYTKKVGAEAPTQLGRFGRLSSNLVVKPSCTLLLQLPI